MVDAEILAYYEHGLERDRLASGASGSSSCGYGTCLERCLPAAPATVVDVGGGAGAYAIPLASAGYEVHLIDPVPLHVEQAAAASRRARHPAGQHLGWRRAGSAASRRQCRRRLAARPALPPHEQGRPRHRAARGTQDPSPGAVAAAKALSRFYPVFEELAADPPANLEGLDDTARFLADGQYRNPGGDPAHFTTSYFHRPEELADEIADAGLELRHLVAASGSVKLLPGLSRLLDIPEARDHLLSVLRLLEAEPSLLGLSQNFVAIAQGASRTLKRARA